VLVEVAVRRAGRRALVWVAFGSGFAVMNSEIAAGRMLAPYYGTSTTTWAVLIATVLGSLALGSLLGGNLSRRGEPGRWLLGALVGSALLLVLLPWVGRALLAGSIERLRGGHVFALGAMLVAVALALTVPLVLLGTVAPLLLHVAGAERSEQELGAELGRIAGKLNAAATVGSLLGTLGAGLLFVPWLGTSRTLCLGSALLLGSAALLLRGRPGRAPLMAGLGLCLLLANAGAEAATSTGGRGRLVWQGESAYQHLVVTEVDGERQLRVNDGFALQSFAYMDGRIPARGVFAYYGLAPSLTLSPAPKKVLLLGLGGGTTAELYRRLFPGMQLTGVELDRAMVRAGVDFLGVDLSGVELVFEDARVFTRVEASRRRATYDIIILDAFQFPYVPFQLTTLEFFAELDTLLAQGGVVMINVGRYDSHREVVDAVAGTLCRVFPYVQAADASNRSNTILVGTRHAPGRAVGLRGLRVDAVTLRKLRSIAATLKPFALFTPDRGTATLSDDHAPIEWLTDRVFWDSLRQAVFEGHGI
jgi:spermidine synthase